MAKLWAKVDGTWVSLGAQTKQEVGLGNVQNWATTNSSTDGSSSKYATGAALKEAYDYAQQVLNNVSGGVSLSAIQRTGERNVRSAKEMGQLLASIPSNSIIVGGAYESGDSARLKYRRIL